MDGTGTGPVSPGAVGEFPGADLPFGMIQWSPDTVPNAAAAGGGYSYADSHINGFSLTHLSGTGCAVYQDVPILPTVGPVGTDPMATTESFSHSTEHAASRSICGQARFARCVGRVVGDDEDRHLPVRLSSHHPGERPVEGGRQCQPGEPVGGPDRGRRRSERTGHERTVLPDGHELHGLFRCPFQSAVLVGGNLGRELRPTWHRPVLRFRLRRLPHLRHRAATATS